MQIFMRRIANCLSILLIIVTMVGCSSTGSAAATEQTVATSSKPVNLQVALDQTARVEALIPEKGGQVKMTLNNGLVYTLDIPEGALLSDMDVTMTPIRSIDGMPLSGGLIAGVQLEPDGTTLLVPATLTINVPNGYDIHHMVGFGYHGTGESFHLSPADGDGSIITMKILSFSGHGAASGTDGEINSQANQSTGSSADDYEQQAADILHGAKARDGNITDAEMKKLTDLLKDEYDNVVKPSLQSAVGDDSKIDSAASTFLGWWRNSQLLGIEDELQSRTTEGLNLLFKGLKNAFDQASKRCVSNQDINEAGNMIERLRQLELLGANDSSYTLDGKKADFDRCLRFKVDFESIVTLHTGASFDIISHVASTVVLKMDQNEGNGLMQLYRGSGDLEFKEYSTEFVGDAAAMNAFCKSEQTSSNGTIEALGKISFGNLNSKNHKASILLGIKPTTLQQTFPKFHCESGTQWLQTNLSTDFPIWSTGFDKIHKDIKGSLEDLNDAYWFSKFESYGGKVIGRLTDSKSVDAGNGDSFTDDLTISILASPGAE